MYPCFYLPAHSVWDRPCAQFAVPFVFVGIMEYLSEAFLEKCKKMSTSVKRLTTLNTQFPPYFICFDWLRIGTGSPRSGHETAGNMADVKRPLFSSEQFETYVE